MDEQEHYKVEMIARCREQGHELAEDFGRIIVAAVKKNSRQLLEEHWWNAVCAVSPNYSNNRPCH